MTKIMFAILITFSLIACAPVNPAKFKKWDVVNITNINETGIIISVYLNGLTKWYYVVNVKYYPSTMNVRESNLRKVVK